MSQLSQFSEGGFSDIITNVDDFIEENEIGPLLVDDNIIDGSEDEQDCKPAPGNQFATPSNHYQYEYPPEQPRNLCTEEYSGPFNFEVCVLPTNKKTPWEFSPKLNKIFIGINLKFPVAFSLKHRPNKDLFIRATPVFTQTQFFQEIVQRCVGHQHPHDPTNQGLPVYVYQHVIRCSSTSTLYNGDVNLGGRLNIVIPLRQPETGTDYVKEFFSFACASSCPQGMNRRPIDIVFTLEDTNGEVFGRRAMSVRICSCPKRDRDKEEKDLEKNNAPRGKRIRLDEEDRRAPTESAIDTKLYKIPITVSGKSNYIHVLTVARDCMASEILKSKGQGAERVFQKCFTEINSLLEKVQSD